MENEKLLKLQHFFTVDSRIKKVMYESAPPRDYIDEHSIEEYTNELDENLSYIFTELKCICSDYFGIESGVYNKVIELENKIKTRVAECGFDIERLNRFYQTDIGKLNNDFVELVKAEYYNTGSIDKSLNMASSINEILHLIHSYIVNSEYIYKSIPTLQVKQNDVNCDISLRGYESSYFNELFDLIPSNLDSDEIDLVVLNENNAIMMVRARGHALTIEINISRYNAYVKYFIPKICNIDMVNNLKGVNKVNDNNIGTTGAFMVDINDLPNELVSFISKVPTDEDAPEREIYIPSEEEIEKMKTEFVEQKKM